MGLRESEPRLQEGLVKPTQGLLGDEAEEEVLADGAPDLGGVGLGDGRQGPEAFRGDVPQGEADGDGIEALLLLLEEVGAPPGVKAWGKGEGLFGRAGKPWGLGLWGRGPGAGSSPLAVSLTRRLSSRTASRKAAIPHFFTRNLSRAWVKTLRFP